MQIENKTAYDTTHLRAIFSAVNVKVRKQEGRSMREGCRIRVTYRRGDGSGVTGRAYIDMWNAGSRGVYSDRARGKIKLHPDITMCLPRPSNFKSMVENNGGLQAVVGRIAEVFGHEMYHHIGYQHNRLRHGHNRYPIDRDRFKNLPLALAPPKPPKPIKIKPTAMERREARARAGLIKWEKKLAVAQKHVKEYGRKVKYYDKKKEVRCLKQKRVTG